MKTDTVQFVTQIGDVTYEDIPADVSARTKRYIQDLVGVAVAAKRSDDFQTVQDFAGDFEASGDVSQIGTDDGISPVGAALVNGTAGHGWDFDDIYDPNPLHSATVVIPAALSVAEHVEASGRELVRAVALGMETQCRLATAADMTIWESGWHRTPTAGIFGATLSSSVLLDASPEEMVNALSIAYSECSGPIQVTYDEAETKRYHAGMAASNGVRAALLAHKGFSGTDDPLLGKYGYFDVFEGTKPIGDSEETWYDGDALFAGLGEEFLIVKNGLKRYPCCRAVHTTIDAGLELKATYDLSIDDVREVVVSVEEFPYQSAGQPEEKIYDPQDIIDIQFNIPWGLVVALDDDTPFIDAFDHDALDNDRYRDVLPRVSVEKTEFDDSVESNPGGPNWTSDVTVTTTTGDSYSVQVHNPTGHYLNPMTEEELDAKFIRCVKYGQPDASESALSEYASRFKNLEDERIDFISSILSK